LAARENFNNAKKALCSFFDGKRASFNRKKFFVFVWLLGVVVLNGVLSGGAVRYNTLLLPPLLLSYAMMVQANYFGERKSKTVLAMMLVLTLALGIITSAADYEFAAVYREFSEELPHEIGGETGAVYFVGSGGFQYYMEQAGYRMLSEDATPMSGDIVVSSKFSFPRSIRPELEKKLQLVDSVVYDGKIPLRVHNSDAHAGFYTYGAGFLPYSVSRVFLDQFNIYRVGE
jgi:hypothetical protein